MSGPEMAGVILALLVLALVAIDLVETRVSGLAPRPGTPEPARPSQDDPTEGEWASLLRFVDAAGDDQRLTRMSMDQLRADRARVRGLFALVSTFPAAAAFAPGERPVEDLLIDEAQRIDNQIAELLWEGPRPTRRPEVSR